jgi:predicted nucleic acid-binding protein
VYLFDTNVVSALRFPDRQPPGLLAWASRIDFADCYLSVITQMEIEVGVLRLERRDPRSAVGLRQWVESEVQPTFAGRILPVDEAVAIACAGLHVPDPRPERDALIAATAMVHGLTVATRNARDFRGLPVALVDPWQLD